MVALVAGALNSCNFLDRYPDGDSILQETYEGLDNRLEGSVRGIYALTYQSGSSESHDWFSKRSIDMYEDMLSSDMALTNYSYGWFQMDEAGRTITSRSGTIWTYYYRMLHNTNAVLRLIREQSDLIDKIDNDPKLEKDSIYTDADIQNAYYYAQALAMRGYAYGNLVRMFVYETGYYQENTHSKIENYDKCPPIYTELNMDSLQHYSTGKEIYDQAYGDLKRAITIFEKWSNRSEFGRDSKIAVDVNVARGILSYIALNKLDYANAFKYAKDVIDSGEYTILPNTQLTTNGFNSVSSPNWMWGQKVTSETSSGLASFWGQVDIHCYSYAWIGDTKAIDDSLYKEIPAWDGRKLWFNDGKKNPIYKCCPDGKFFSAINQFSTKAEDIDREWINDNVYMRIETMYLIAAEASYYMGDYANAINYLMNLTDNRVLANDTTGKALTEYAKFVTEISSDNGKLLKAIIYNWRVEMWGEGYGWQTFRRLNPTVKRGANHAYDAGKEKKADEETLNYFRIPSNELYYGDLERKDN